MNKILNARVTRLIKDDLLDYGKELLVLLGFFIITIVLIGGMLNSFEVITIDSGEFNIGNIINNILFSICVIVMLIVGITAGVELPQYVRMGIARNEYFISKTVVAVIVSLLIEPIVLTLNIIVNLFVTSESSLYNAFYIGGGETFTLITHFLIYIALFLLGFFITVIWQKMSWKVAIILTSICVGFLGYLGWSTGNWFAYAWSFFSRLQVIVVIIIVLGMGTYKLIRDVSVNMK